ncbi:hypothetical protein [Nonomuraea sp. NPDC005650]|uniref:hypothetical protein n=1 Tax=Nonomuraea sp. NPDC005650 TaxID=3157045 RepID=UPI0033AB1B7C
MTNKIYTSASHTVYKTAETCFEVYYADDFFRQSFSTEADAIAYADAHEERPWSWS